MKEIIYLAPARPEDRLAAGSAFIVAIGQTRFTVRPSQHLAEGCSVISPKNAERLPQAGQLADYLVSVLGYQKVVFTPAEVSPPRKASRNVPAFAQPYGLQFGLSPIR